ncbi:AraC family transcriptional regulator [Breznakiella homolactica]|uniref:Helix-turn-helix transcriptional regulator n=1 Tax=Breznakiella homolactica TaxID=2798577 RepID=A0A7T7XQU9_9SPIR|nr:AraC family transcriptional regulator [Breznakiella homolactica]QQO10814.1 AraC family transcriptional regulator [Breznakiella homolactica]
MDYKLTFSGRFHYRCGSGVSGHYHPEDYQIQLVYSGEAEAHVNGKPYRLKKNSIMLIPKGSAHDFHVISEDGMKTVEVKFVSDDPGFTELISGLDMVMADDGSIFEILSRVVLEGQRKISYYREMSNALLLECLLMMYRMAHRNSIPVFEVSKLSKGEIIKNDILLDVIDDYIEKNIHKRFSLADVAKACGYNQDYIYRLIRKKTGLSAVQYINEKKFDRAKQLIMHTELSLSEIAWNLGFETLQYFSRFFKEHAGISPSDYSKEVRSTIRTDY